jgi:hypothetical protein
MWVSHAFLLDQQNDAGRAMAPPLGARRPPTPHTTRIPSIASAREGGSKPRPSISMVERTPSFDRRQQRSLKTNRVEL